MERHSESLVIYEPGAHGHFTSSVLTNYPGGLHDLKYLECDIYLAAICQDYVDIWHTTQRSVVMRMELGALPGAIDYARGAFVYQTFSHEVYRCVFPDKRAAHARRRQPGKLRGERQHQLKLPVDGEERAMLAKHCVDLTYESSAQRPWRIGKLFR